MKRLRVTLGISPCTQGAAVGVGETLNHFSAAFGVQHNKVQPTQGMALAPFGYVPHFMGDEATDEVGWSSGSAAFNATENASFTRSIGVSPLTRKVRC